MLYPKAYESAFFLFVLSITLLNSVAQLYEGSPCVMEDGSDGECIEIPKCPYRIRQIKEGKYRPTSSAHCSFNNFIEIVCCPKKESMETVLPGNDGSPCTMEDGRAGDCTALTKCPMRIKQILEGKRFDFTSARCSFNGFTEIVCCPRVDTTDSKIVVSRPADQVCRDYENEISGDNGENINPNIFNGEAAEMGEFPYMVALGYKIDADDPNLVTYICGGTLISNQHILTAAHCVNNINNYVPVEVKLGAVNLNDNGNQVQRIPVRQVIHHPSYRRSLNYFDIAIVALIRPVQYTKYVMPICLQSKPIPNLDQLTRMSLIVTGWGATSLNDAGSPNLQKTPSLEVIDRIKCNEFYQGFNRLPKGVDESFLCLLDNNVTRRADACQGDSGGPLLLLSRVTSTVLGVTSFGQSCGSPIPSIYTSVIHYLDWIERTVWPDKFRIG